MSLLRRLPRVFGPVLLYDMVRTARRPQLLTLRCLYAGLLLVTLVSVWCRWATRPGQPFWENVWRFTLTRESAAQFTTLVFEAYLAVQFVALLLLTPACTAGALAEEKERRGLDYLFATDLSSREIVLSILVSRLANLVLVLLSGLPILALLQLLGGLDPNLVLGSFAATGLTLLSLGSFSILCSVYARKPRTAMLLAGMGAVAYLLLSWLLGLMALSSVRWSVTIAPSGFYEHIIAWINAGNPYTVWRDISVELANETDTLAHLLWTALGKYAVFHGLAAVLCVTWAIHRLRPVALRQAGHGHRKRYAWHEGWTGLPIRRPRVGNWPMLWKELYVEAVPLRAVSLLLFLMLLVYVCLLPAFVILALIYWERTDELVYLVAPLVREGGMLVACLMLLGVAIRAAGSVSGERERDTLDPLLLAPQDSNNILVAKWLGSILGVRQLALWWVALLLLGMTVGQLDGSAAFGYGMAWLVYAAFLASLGLWFSVICRTGQRALLATVIAAGLAFGGHWLFWMLLAPVAGLVVGHSIALPFAAEVQTYGLTPPLLFRQLGTGRQLPYLQPVWHDELLLPALLTGLSLYGLGAVLLWSMASKRFRKITGRSLATWQGTEAGVSERPAAPRPRRPQLPPVELNWP